MGFKTFVSETLTAGDMNDLVMKQTNIRCVAAGKPTGEEGMEVHLTDEDRSNIHNGSTWVRTGWWSPAGRTGCQISRAAAQAIPSGTATTITWDAEASDVDGFIATPSGSVVVPAGLGGLYVCTVTINYGGTVGSSGGNLTILQNGTASYCTISPGSASDTNTTVTTWAPGDTLSVQVLQTSGASLNTNSVRLDFWRIGA